VGVSLDQWLILALAGLLVGITKTAIGGLGAIIVALFAFVFPAKESTASSTFLLISGDVMAVLMYRAQADWKLIRNLLPAVIPGIAAGAVFMHFASDKVMLLSIGSCLTVTLLLQFVLRHQRNATPPPDTPASRARVVAIGATGLAAGFVTIVGNAAAAVMGLYVLVTHTDKMRFVASAAWFYFILNLIKAPFIIGLGIVNWHHVVILLTLLPLVVIGGLAGRKLLGHIGQHQFEAITLITTIAACATLLIRGIIA
jgi:uncharacterized membrane protein YfcA